jgi:hypothetical protein
MDAVFYLRDAMRLFSGKTLDEVREVTFEIGLQGQYGLDINDPTETHILRSLHGRTFSTQELLCIMYAGLKRIDRFSTLICMLGLPAWLMSLSQCTQRDYII